MIIYSNSCSFGALNNSYPVYSEIIAKTLNAQLVNKGKPGSCNRRIIRTTLRDLNEITDDVIVLIGLTFISRSEIWRPDLPAVDNDGHFYQIKPTQKLSWPNGLMDTIIPNIHEKVDPEIRNYYKEWILHYDREATMTELCADLVMLIGWLRSKGITYKIFSNVDKLEGSEYIGYNSPFISSLQDTILKDEGVIDPWKFSFGTFAREQGLRPIDEDVLGVHGHPGARAHELFAKYLTEKL
tara:strand:- start:43 stop:762 length:720 start_codon:yes stop_codon:yes gene_type:complete